MKQLLIAIFFCFLSLTYGQTCGCTKMPMLKHLISCKQTRFKNGAKIFWEYDCNSSWITFQKGKHIKKIFNLGKEDIDYSGRLGYRNWKEYKNSFLIENSMVSGCCQPSEYILYSKETGDKIRELGTIIFSGDSRIYPYTLTMMKNDLLLFTNLTNNKSYNIKVPKDKIEKTLKNTETLYAENLFENIQLKKGLLLIQLNYLETKNSKWKKQMITFNTKKYLK